MLSPMNGFLRVLGPGLSFFSAGLVVGLGFIAAAVKFTASRPDLLDLLDVGRVQFAALHLAERFLVPAACVSVILAWPRLWKTVTLTLVCYLAKAIVIQPTLSARMMARLSGEQVPNSGIHEGYVYVATGLVALLVLQGALGIRAWVVDAANNKGVESNPSASHAGVGGMPTKESAV